MFIFLNPLLILHCSAGSSSDLKKDDEVKRLPGGKVKKKVTFQEFQVQVLMFQILGNIILSFVSINN